MPDGPHAALARGLDGQRVTGVGVAHHARARVGVEHALEAPVAGTLRLRVSSFAAGLTAADRIIARGAVWNIRGGPSDPDGRGRYLDFLVERGGAVE